MKTTPAMRVWFAITALVCVPFGIAALLVPGAVGGVYGSETNSEGLLWARYYGAAIAFVGGVAWGARSTREPETLRFITLLLALLFTVNLAVSIYALWLDVLNVLHWTTIAAEVVLVSVWGFYRLRSTEPARALAESSLNHS